MLFQVGMGKTIMISALIQTSTTCEEVSAKEAEGQHATRARQLRLNHAFKPRVNAKVTPVPSATLIVAPTSLLNQWAEELQRSSKPGTLDVTVWHGSNRLDLTTVVNEDEDEDGGPIKVVITSYGTLASEHAKIERFANARSPIYESM